MTRVYASGERLGTTESTNNLERTEARSKKAFYPRVLICSLSRVNQHDTMSNNLLLRNLFAEWPREQLAQIYSGGDNKDRGFCGSYYHISAQDRSFGKSFFGLKGMHSDDPGITRTSEVRMPAAIDYSLKSRLKGAAGKVLLKSGLYELLFRIRPSSTLINWSRDFAPDLIFAQGYNLSFIRLVLLLREQLQKPIAYYSTDDWPSYLYASREGLLSVTAPLMRRVVTRAARNLFAQTDIPFSFNAMMGEEYEKRYGKPFSILMHCDDPERFRLAEPIRLHPIDCCSIIATGGFDDSRWPLLLDLEKACAGLNQEGYPTRAAILATSITEEGYSKIKTCRYLDLRDDPGHDILPKYLKGADILYLPETFDEDDVRAYKYSISTKAHLFMLSQRPILAYGHPQTGLMTYAQREGWALTVNQRNVDLLRAGLKELLSDAGRRQSFITRANIVAITNHDSQNVRKIFLSRLRDTLGRKDE
jgi:hypothetical protein